MYLSTVLEGINGKKILDAEDLYKLNEAIFNLPEEDTMDAKMTAKLFGAIEKAAKSYTTGKYDLTDSNFFYDYVALLGTMQNQHFFSQKQNKMMLGWLKDALEAGDQAGEKGVAKEQTKEPKATDAKVDSKALAKLEDENKKLREELSTLRELAAAVMVLKTVKLPKLDEKVEAKGQGKGKAESKEKVDSSEAQNKGKGKGKKSEAAAEPAAEAAEEETGEPLSPEEEARKAAKAKMNAAGRALAKKKKEVIEKYGVEADKALDHEEVRPLFEKLKALKELHQSLRGPKPVTA